jgi:hypothetical protein
MSDGADQSVLSPPITLCAPIPETYPKTNDEISWKAKLEILHEKTPNNEKKKLTGKKGEHGEKKLIIHKGKCVVIEEEIKGQKRGRSILTYGAGKMARGKKSFPLYYIRRETGTDQFCSVAVGKEQGDARNNRIR